MKKTENLKLMSKFKNLSLILSSIYWLFYCAPGVLHQEFLIPPSPAVSIVFDGQGNWILARSSITNKWHSWPLSLRLMSPRLGLFVDGDSISPALWMLNSVQKFPVWTLEWRDTLINWHEFRPNPAYFHLCANFLTPKYQKYSSFQKTTELR